MLRYRGYNIYWEEVRFEISGGHHVTAYLKDLPEVAVNGTTHKFLNNVGFGIDGYCTEMGDKMRAAHKEKINYTSIAIMGLLGKFHSVSARITVDGLTKEYEDVWLAPTMNGAFLRWRHDADAKPEPIK